MELTEERLAVIETAIYRSPEWADLFGDILALVAEVRRLRNDRDEARGLAREFHYALLQIDSAQVRKTDLVKEVMVHPWLLEPEPATATGVAEAVLGMTQAEEKPELQGEIKVGEHFIWEPRSAAYQRIVVTRIGVNSDGETVIESENKRGERHWNDEQRFREACVRSEDQIS